jgi:apolipoprotein N-acyltransferase
LLRAEFRDGPPWRAAALAAAALLAAVGYGELRLRQPFATGAEVSLALVQAAVPAERRFDPQHLERSFALQTSLSLRAAEQRPSLILWPEYAIDFPLREGTPAWERLTRLSRLTGAELLVGALSLAGGSGQRSNSAFLVGETGPRDRYDKVELMPFAEWAPLGGPPRHGADYAAGVSARPLGSRAGPIGVLLCNEAMHSGHARKASLEGAEILANPANDAWFGPLGAAHQLDVVSVRAIENRRYLVRPTLTGQSAVVDAHGRVLTRTRYGETEVLAGVVRRSTAETPYQRFGAALPGAAGALALAASARRLRRRSTGGEA